MMPRRIRIFWISVIVFAVLNLCVSVHATEIQAGVDRTQMGSGESLELTVSVKDGEGSVDISPIRDFKVMSGGTSTSVQIINGRMSK